MARAEIIHAYTDGATVTMAVETTTESTAAATDCIARVVELYKQVVPDEAE